MGDNSPLERTQVQFERWQYDALKARASREKRSVSGIVREAVTAFLASPTASPTVGSIAGLASDVTLRGDDHDALLYPGGRSAGEPPGAKVAATSRPPARTRSRRPASLPAVDRRARTKAR